MVEYEPQRHKRLGDTMKLSIQKMHFFRVILVFVMSAAFSCMSAADSFSESARTHPELEKRFKGASIAALIPPDVKVYELSAGGVSELRDDWCEVGRKNVVDAVKKSCGDKRIDVKEVAVDKDMEEELEEVLALYRAVSVSIGLHVYGQFIFPDKVQRFDYSVGPIDNLLRRFGADYLMIVYGLDEISTAGRKALSAAATVIAAMAGVIIVPQRGVTLVSAALVDSSGAILWFNIKGGRGGFDLRDCDSAASIVSSLLAELPDGAVPK
jgi:hypothetical protein